MFGLTEPLAIEHNATSNLQLLNIVSCDDTDIAFQLKTGPV